MSGLPPAITPEVLHGRYAQKIDRHVRAFLGHDTEHEDLVQEVFITVFRRIGTLRDPRCMDRWVNQVTTNTLKQALRQRRLRRHASWEAMAEPESGSFQVDVEMQELASRALRILSQLPENDRALLMSYWFSPATAGAIAEETGCSLVTVRRRLFKARSRFARLARRDPALARCVADATSSTREWQFAGLAANG